MCDIGRCRCVGSDVSRWKLSKDVSASKWIPFSMTIERIMTSVLEILDKFWASKLLTFQWQQEILLTCLIFGLGLLSISSCRTKSRSRYTK